MNKIICYYRRNLDMTPQKLAAQVGHVVANLCLFKTTPDKVIVLKASDNKFNQYKRQYPDAYMQKDAGYTELPAGEETVIGWWEEEKVKVVEREQLEMDL